MAEESDGNSQGAVQQLDDAEWMTPEVRQQLRDAGVGVGSVIGFSKEQLSLMKMLLHPPDDGDAFIQIALTLEFESDEERREVVDAYYEADRLGMNTQWNIADALSRCALNGRKARQTSRSAQIMDTLSHSKFTQMGRDGKKGKPITANPRSLLE